MTDNGRHIKHEKNKKQIDCQVYYPDGLRSSDTTEWLIATTWRTQTIWRWILNMNTRTNEKSMPLIPSIHVKFREDGVTSNIVKNFLHHNTWEL